VLLVLHNPSLVETSPKASPLLHLHKLGGVAHVAGGPPRPVHVAAFGALPVISREQTLGLLGRRSSYFYSLFFSFIFFLLEAASVTA